MTWTQFFTIIKIICIVFAPFLISCTIWYIYWRYIKGIKPKKGEYKKIGHGNIIKKLL
ncbi:MAG: hypothetical protein FWF94_03020 [Oscillospiraceae bacterium]|nr:hypothetical protein [Oscillospiraceae bacterium]